MAVITLTTDFGTRDTYVAEMKAAILSITRDVQVVDITHEVAPHDVLSGALALEAAAPWFPQATIHVAVVDPGVGTARRGLAVASRDQVFIGPDNGLFTPFLGGPRWRAFELLVRDNDRRVMETLARATVSMTEAEVFQLDRKRSGVTTETDYVRIITQKTASFISACCRIGGLLGGLPAAQVDALTQYGLDIGVAFQISDDSLDFVADQDRLGKAIGADLREGKRTLPLIAMLARATPAESERVKSLLKRHALDAEEIDEIRRYVVGHEGVEYALAQAHGYARAAKAALAAFTPSEERETLALIADFVVDRDR